MKTHQRVARWPLARDKLAPVVAVQVSQDDAPLLFAATTNRRRRGARCPHRPAAPRRETAGTDPLALADSLKRHQYALDRPTCSKTPRAPWRSAPHAAACWPRSGKLLTGAALLPLLPIDRSSRAQAAEPAAKGAKSKAATDDPESCEYWKYCAIDGFLCSCCGGSSNSCPPGTAPSPITWIGTCHNPADSATTSFPTTTAAVRPAAATANATATSARSRCTARRATTTSTGAWRTPTRTTTARCPSSSGSPRNERGSRAVDRASAASLLVAAAPCLAADPAARAYPDGRQATFQANCAVCHGAGRRHARARPAAHLLSGPLCGHRRGTAAAGDDGAVRHVRRHHVEQNHYDFKMPEFSHLTMRRLRRC